MREQDYAKFVWGLIDHPVKSPHPRELHMVLGIVTEAGELADAFKKVNGYQLELDMDNVIEEMGDILFYLTGLCEEYGLSVDDLRNRNYAKLSERYPEGFSQKAAVERKDKDGTE